MNIFTHKDLPHQDLHQDLPFAVKDDPFYTSANMAHLRQVAADYQAGRNFSEHKLVDPGESDTQTSR